MMPSEMHVTAARRAGGAVLGLHGELDALAAPRLAGAVEAALAAGARRVVLDLGHVRFCGSTGIEAVLAAARALAARGGALAVARASPFCRRVLEAVGVERFVAFLDSDAAAEGWLAESARSGAPATS